MGRARTDGRGTESCETEGGLEPLQRPEGASSSVQPIPGTRAAGSLSCIPSGGLDLLCAGPWCRKGIRVPGVGGTGPLGPQACLLSKFSLCNSRYLLSQ